MRPLCSAPPTTWLALVALVAAGACGSGDRIGPSTDGDVAKLRVTAEVVGTPVDRMVATVSAGDIPTPLVFNLPVADGVATGTLRITPGAARTITLQAFESSGEITHEGSATIDVRAGQNPPVTIAMLPRSGQVPITATITSVSVIVSPASATMEIGESRQFTAEIRGPDNEPVQGTVEWAVTNPALAIVEQDGTVTALGEGTLTLVATYGGVAGTAALVVGAGSPPASSRAKRVG